MDHEQPPETPFQKKTERLDIRVSYDKKKAFAEACENQGDTPSNAVRRFISTYIRREQRDELASAIRFSPKKRYAGYALLAGFIAISGSFIWSAVEAQKQNALTQELFVAYDNNENNLIDIGEISSNDFHLQRVLNIDGVEGISKAEFRVQGRMMWQFVNSETYEIWENKNDKDKQTSMTLMSSTVALDGTPINDPNQKIYIPVDGEFIELGPEMSPKEALDLLSRSDEVARHPAEYSEAYIAEAKKYASKMVEFDLRNPKQINITVLEQQTGGTAVQKIANFKRSVDWVEGRLTPEHVMGEGRETAVLTEIE